MHNYAVQVLDSLSTSLKRYQTQSQVSAHDIDFGVGEIRLEYPTWLRETLASVMRDVPLGYGNPQGLLGLRRAYVQHLDHLGTGLDESNVLITAGAKEALWVALITVLGTGDTILMPRPGWPPYMMWAQALGATVDQYDPCALDVAEEIVASLHSGAPRVLLLNFPHNPTGAELSADQMERILSAAEFTGTTVIADEVYRRFSDADVPVSILPHLSMSPGRFIYVDSVSKMLGLAGLRIGFLVADPAILKRLEVVRSSFGSCVSSPAQAMVEHILLDDRQRDWVSDIVTESRACLRMARAGFARQGYKIASAGAIYLWLEDSASSTATSDGSVVIGDATVKISEGATFGAPGYFRACPIRPKSILEEVFGSGLYRAEAEKVAHDC